LFGRKRGPAAVRDVVRIEEAVAGGDDGRAGLAARPHQVRRRLAARGREEEERKPTQGHSTRKHKTKHGRHLPRPSHGTPRARRYASASGSVWYASDRVAAVWRSAGARPRERVGKRSRSTWSAMRASVRASVAPRQVWMPAPNATCSARGRVGRK